LGIFDLLGNGVIGFYREIENQLGPVSVVDISTPGVQNQLTSVLDLAFPAIFAIVQNLDEKKPAHKRGPDTKTQGNDQQCPSSLIAVQRIPPSQWEKMYLIVHGPITLWKGGNSLVKPHNLLLGGKDEPKSSGRALQMPCVRET
jgi:hypothetical protein